MATIRATISGLFMGQTVMHVLHFTADSYTLADLTLLATDLRDNFLTLVQPRLTAEFTYTNINTRVLGGPPDPSFNLTVAVVGSAGSDPDSLPTNSVVLRLLTGFIGKHGRGRLYLPCLGPFCINFGVITPGCIALYQTLGNNILSRYGPTGTSNYTLVICNRSDPSDTHIVTSITPRSTPGTQRRRTIGVGI